MAIVGEKKLNSKGNAVVRVELLPGEELMIIKRNSHYKLGCQVDDVVHADIILESESTYWCSITQMWV
jgi:hypothetical protein